MTDATRATTKMTVTEFQQMAETNLPTELIDGEVIVSPASSFRHQLISGALYSALKAVLAGGYPFYSPVDLHLDDHDVVQPDLLWVSSDNSACLLTEGYVVGPPTLVIEILSPSTALRDRREKFKLYEGAGVSEYWLVEPAAQMVEVYRLVENQFARQGVFGAEDGIISPLFEQPLLLKAVFAAA